MSEGNGFVTLEALITPKAVPERIVHVPELGGNVLIRGMTAAERTTFEKSFRTAKGTPIPERNLQMRQRLLVATIKKPEGLTLAHVKALGEQSAAILEPLVDTAFELCGMTASDADDLSENSEETDDNA